MKLVKTALRAILFLLILESVFVVHEYGHLREFRELGVPVQEFSLGVGPLVYQHQTASFALSFRLIPIMAYVAPTEEGGNLFRKQGSLWNKIAVDTAGVRNNVLMGLTIVFSLQTLGWLRGNISPRELAKAALVTPVKILLRFFAFLIGCATLGRVNLAGRFLLSTGGINPPKPLKQFALWNLSLGLINLAPVPPLDGGHLAQAILSSAGINADIPGYLSVILFVAFFITLGEQDMRVLEIEPGTSNAKPEMGTADLVFDSDILSSTLSTRVKILLTDSGIYTVGKLREATAEQLMQIHGFGPKSLAEVEAFLLKTDMF